MGLFSAALLAELAKSLTGTPPETWPGIKIVTPGRTFLWTSKGGGAGTHGAFEERVLDWGGEFGPDIDLQADTVASWELRLVVTDLGENETERRQWAREFAKYRSTLRRSPATLYPFLSPNVSDADQFAIPLLVLSSSAVAPMTFEITVKPDTTVFEQGVMQKVPIAVYFLAAHETATGGYAPIIYGKHDSNGAGGAGMILCPYVDTVNRRYLISLGRIKSVLKVFADGELVSAAGYSLVYETIKGTDFSLLSFTADQGDAEITIDCEGLTDNPNGAGTLIENPAEIWRHAVVQFGFNDYRRGAYYANSTAPLDNASIDGAVAYLARATRYKGSFVIPGAEQWKIQDFTNTFLKSHPLYGYWSPVSKLSLGFIDEVAPATIYPTGSAFIEGDIDEEDGFGTPADSELITKEMNVQYVRNESTGDYGSTLKVADLSVVDEVAESLQMDWAKRALL